jgi:hypothetical protein
MPGSLFITITSNAWNGLFDPFVFQDIQNNIQSILPTNVKLVLQQINPVPYTVVLNYTDTIGRGFYPATNSLPMTVLSSTSNSALISNATLSGLQSNETITIIDAITGTTSIVFASLSNYPGISNTIQITSSSFANNPLTVNSIVYPYIDATNYLPIIKSYFDNLKPSEKVASTVFRHRRQCFPGNLSANITGELTLLLNGSLLFDSCYYENGGVGFSSIQSTPTTNINQSSNMFIIDNYGYNITFQPIIG